MPTTADPGTQTGAVTWRAGRPRWVFGSPAGRWLAAIAALLALLSLVITVNAARTRPTYRTVLSGLAAPPGAVDVDATGCPATAKCVVVQHATGLLDAAFVRAFPAGQVLNVEATVDLDSDETYRSSLLGVLGTSTISLTTQCVPRAPRSRARLDRSVTAFLDLAGNSVIQSRQLSVLVPGRPGCGVAMLLRTPGSAGGYEAAALRLASDPATQLPP